jgi:hypothetical protein
MTDIQNKSAGDYSYALAKGALGMIPIAGAPAQEILGMIVTPPLEKRRTEFLLEMGERLKFLEENKGIDLESLSSNDQFVDAVLQAMSLALKTSEREKLTAFKNAITHIAIKDSPAKTICQIFLNLIDIYTPLHIRI